ncbi:hypothetical protein AgCh_021567 [Apium graveolens]
MKENFGSSTSTNSHQPILTSTNLQIQSLQQQVSDLQTPNASLNAQVQALTSLIKSQQSDIQTLVDSHKHLQMQNSVALGVIMGNLNISLLSLPEQIRPKLPTPLFMPVTKTKREIEARIQQSRDAKAKSKQPIQVSQSTSAQIDVGKERLQKAAEGPNQDQEFRELLAVLRMTQNIVITVHRRLAEAHRRRREKSAIEKSPDKDINPYRLASRGPKRIRNQLPTS